MINQSNNFDNIKVSIANIHNILNALLSERAKEAKKNNILLFISCRVRFYFDAILQILNLNYFLIINGFRKKWFIKFQNYWTVYLNGRPLKLHEFFYKAHHHWLWHLIISLVLFFQQI